MKDENAISVSAFARSITDSCRELPDFEASETIEAGPIVATAQIRVHRPLSVAVEYRSYTNPLLDLEERLTGDAEFTSEEIVGLSLHYDGHATWCYDASTGVCLVKPSRALFEPVPDMDLVGELDYLRDLLHDYLLRDAGTETIDGCETRVLSLKPKRVHRAHAFKLVTFLAQKASVAFDAETGFPVRLTFAPAPSTQTAQVLGQGGRVTVRYEGVRPSAKPATPFAPPEGTRIFHESAIPVAELFDRLPFPFPTVALTDAGFAPIERRARLAEDTENGRAYCVASFLRNEDSTDDAPGLITVRVGNYLSRNMARRRVTASESGEELTVAGHPARLLDRRPLWDENAAGLDADRAPRELSWEHDGVFWFLIGHDVDRGTLEKIATGLTDAPSTAPS
jgi:hypothetical protein